MSAALAVHGASHRFERLSWLFDLKLHALAYPTLRWDLVARRAAEHRVRGAVALAVHLLSAWLRFDVSDGGCLERLREGRAYLARELARPRPSHVGNALASFAFAAVLCEPSAALAYGATTARVKLLHEAPLRVRSYFAD